MIKNAYYLLKSVEEGLLKSRKDWEAADVHNSYDDTVKGAPGKNNVSTLAGLWRATAKNKGLSPAKTCLCCLSYPPPTWRKNEMTLGTDKDHDVSLSTVDRKGKRIRKNMGAGEGGSRQRTISKRIPRVRSAEGKTLTMARSSNIARPEVEGWSS